jgi:hypothetical protein
MPRHIEPQQLPPAGRRQAQPIDRRGSGPRRRGQGHTRDDRKDEARVPAVVLRNYASGFSARRTWRKVSEVTIYSWPSRPQKTVTAAMRPARRLRPAKLGDQGVHRYSGSERLLRSHGLESWRAGNVRLWALFRERAPLHNITNRFSDISGVVAYSFNVFGAEE